MASTIKVNNIQNQCGANIVNKCSTTITLGASGDNITLAAGATQSGFGRTGTVNWDTTAKTTGFTAVSGNGYFVNTTSGAITVTLPATPSAGDIVAIKDYANTADTNKITINRNSSNIDGNASNYDIVNEGQSITLVYVDGTRGWVPTDAAKASDFTEEALFVTATGGTVLTCGNYKTHVFTGPGTFCVSCGGNAQGSNTVEYLIVAGGGGGGSDFGGGAGAGGFRTYTALCGASPLNAASALPVSTTAYPITVGAGGTGGDDGNPAAPATNGSNSIFSSITSAGGGAGGCGAAGGGVGGCAGGSGGGGRFNAGPTAGGAGNTPPVSPPQGQPGGPAPTGPPYKTGGGGGAAAAGQTKCTNAPPSVGADGGDGSYIPTAFIGPTSPSYGETGPAGRYFAGGGGAGGYSNAAGNGGLGGGGGVGAGGPSNSAIPGTVNTGGGASGAPNDFGPSNRDGGNGGSGIVMIRYKYQ